MNTADMVSNPALRGNTELRNPRTPASFVRLGAERRRIQSTGDAVVFRSVKLRTDYTDVPSKLFDDISTWHTLERVWVPVDALIDGQREIVRTV